jgi:hypothetical protein
MFAVSVLMAGALTIGCASRSLTAQPLPVDRVECARCRMLISNDRTGGQIVSASEDVRFYDDIGCLAADWRTHHEGARAFVRIDGEWVEADSLAFAQPLNARTAMGSGIEAFAAPDAARAADRDGRALTFSDLVRGDAR